MGTQERFKVICIDDESEILDLMSEYVKREGFTPVTFSSPSAAMTTLNGDLTDVVLVISDFKMPEMTGLELRKNCFENSKHLPFIILSGFISREEALKAVELKIAGFLEKPINEKKLSALIQKETVEVVKSLKDEYEMTSAFLGDAENLLEQMEETLLSLEQAPGNVEIVNHIFALAHTIKGGSGFIKPVTLHKFTHRFEDYLSVFKKSELPVPPDGISTLLTGYDVIKKLVEDLKSGQQTSPPLEELIKIFAVKSPTSAQATANAPETFNQSTKSRATDEIRVSMRLLDEFMELSGEITVIRNMINKLVRAIEKEMHGNKDVALLAELLDEMHKINSQMQEKIIDLRKVPIKTVFRPLPRTLRDLARTLNKDIVLETNGDEIRVDNTIAEVLSNSLTHMIRNGADHAIESPEERRKKGKNPQGKVKISGVDLGETVVVTIEDDGKGIDPKVILEKAIEKKVVTAQQAEKMSKSEIQGLIFESGFSTAAEVTDVSGRGVGMDMVKKAVTRIGGKIVVDSTPGKGSRFDLHLPIPKSVNIIAALLARSGKDVFCLPQDNIFRLISPSDHDFDKCIRYVEGAHLLSLDNEIYPLINLSETLKGHYNAASSRRLPVRAEKEKSAHIVLLQSNETIFGVIVDEILDMEEIVVKDLAKNFRDLKIFSGATFLGDGRVGLILNTDGLAAMNGISIASKSTRDETNTSEKQSTQHLRDMVLFDLGIEGNYGVYLDDIYRLERFDKSQIQYSGKQPVIVYRDAAIPLYCTATELELSKKTVFERQLEYPTLIARSEKGFVGLVVSQIVDLQKAPNVDEIVQDREGVLGATIVNSVTVTVLDVKSLLNNARPTAEIHVEEQSNEFPVAA